MSRKPSSKRCAANLQRMPKLGGCADWTHLNPGAQHPMSMIRHTFFVLGCTFRALLLVIFATSSPAVGFATFFDAMLRIRLRDVAPRHAFLNPVLAWGNLRPFALAWFVVSFVTMAVHALVEVFGGDQRATLLLAWWGVATLACLAYFWFGRDVGTVRAEGARTRRFMPTSQDLAAAIKENIFGQDDNIHRIASLVVERLRAPRHRGPVCTLMLAGPTGTGKTETARLLASALGLPIVIVRCNEYSNRWSIERLIGSQASYQNAEMGGELVNALASSPQGVLVLDEIEKADPSIAKVLMTLLDEGYLTSAFDGRVIDARGWVMLATTNAAHQDVADLMQADLDEVSLRVAVKDALRDHWAPEILGRLDLVLAFRRVTDEDSVARSLVQKALESVFARLPNVQGRLTPESAALLVDASKRVGKYGYRELERYVEEVTTMGLAGAHHGNRRRPLMLEYVVEGRNLRAKVVS